MILVDAIDIGSRLIFSLHKTIKVTPLHKIKQNLNESDKRQDIVKAFCNK